MGGGTLKAAQRTALREAGFTEAQTNAFALALEPLATKQDLRDAMEVLRSDLEVLRNDLRWMKWVGGAIGIAVLAELVSGFSS